jgi:rRNA maturation endonuclease Nob1
MRSACDAETLHCNWCERPMTEEEHDFCDICGECREENELD